MINLNIQIWIIFIHCYFTNANIFGGEKYDLIIDLPQGKVEGSYDLFHNQRKFLGIPFASVQERFQSPGAPPSWNGTFKANKDNIQCQQYDSSSKKAVGVEDCLIINVFTPKYQKKDPLPVMVYIYGGGFDSGSSSENIYNPKFLVKEGVVVVTLNYRLGAFGFLCLGLEEASGNMGLKDQIAALKWVQENIKYFGGNPDSVTIFGESSGSMSISYLVLLPSSKNLFHRAILESGTFLTPEVFKFRPIKSANEVATRLGHNTTDANELLKIFKNESVDNILKASYVDLKNNALATYVFSPCMETSNVNDAVITAKPVELLKEIDDNIPFIIGFNNKEGILWADKYTPIDSKKVMKYLDSIIPYNLVFENKTDKTKFIEDVKELYFKNETAQNGLIDYFTDFRIRSPVTEFSEAVLKNTDNIMYNYYFTYSSTRNFEKKKTHLSEVPGACHADEIFYIFDPKLATLLPIKSKDRKMINIMVKFWTTFAKTGKPTSETIWSPSKNSLKFIELGKTIKMTTLPRNDRIEFWKQTNKKYRLK